MLHDIHWTAKKIGCSPISLYQKVYRARIGLAATRVGAKLLFHEDDVERVIAAGRERLPKMPEEAQDVAD